MLRMQQLLLKKKTYKHVFHYHFDVRQHFYRLPHIGEVPVICTREQQK
jgi:hypothetical protein